MPSRHTTIVNRTRAAVHLHLACALFLPTANMAATPDFYDHWAEDGKAELSSYRIVQSRYGEQRQGHGVLVFVTEDINRQTLIKVESSQPASERIHVLKLNNILKFKTGIYDYSVMTSVFSAVEGGTGQNSHSSFRNSRSDHRSGAATCTRKSGWSMTNCAETSTATSSARDASRTSWRCRIGNSRAKIT